MEESSDEGDVEGIEEVRSRIHETVLELKQQLLANKTPRITSVSKQPFSKELFMRKANFLMEVLQNLDEQAISSDNLAPWQCRILDELQKRKKRTLIQQREMLTSLLNGIIRSVESNLQPNRREFYYTNPSLFKDTSVITKTVNFFSSILEVAPWEMGVSASAKSLIRGPMKIILENGFEIDCSSPNGILIPQSIYDGATFVTDAKYAVILEKDTAFQKLIEEDFISRYGPCILFTAKGYPDVGARFFLRAMLDQLTIPMFLVADADPYGMDIMFTYRFGSPAYESWVDRLGLPEIKWLGVFPRDIRHLSLAPTELSACDMNRVRGLQARPYVLGNSRFSEEINFFVRKRCKCETEDLYTIAPYFLTDVYIPSNIIKKRFI